MKKILLFFLFIGISYFGKAQLTVSGFPGNQGYNTLPNTFYTLTNPGAPTFPNPFVSDAGTNVYKQGKSFAGGFNTNLIIRLGNYWYIGQQTSISVQSGYVHTKTLSARTNVPRLTTDPPCVHTWENVSYVENTGLITPLGTYFTGTLNGSTCDGSSLGTTMLPNLNTLPQLTNADIQAIVSPTAGSMVYNTDNNCISVYNGVSWNCLVQVNTIAISISGFTLTGFYNYIIYTGAAGTMTIPAASTCPNREYFITNYGTGNLTLSNSYTYGNAQITAIIATGTTVHLIASGGSWYKI